VNHPCGRDVCRRRWCKAREGPVGPGYLKAPTMALQVPGPAAPSPPPSTDTPGDSSKANSRGISPLVNHSKWKIIVLN